MCKLKGAIIEFRNPGNTIVVQKSNIKKLFIDKSNAYKKYFEDVYFYTFDKRNIEKIDFPLIQKTLYNKYNFHSIIYAFLTPILHYKILKKADYYFGLQVQSSLYPLYCSFFFKNKKVVVFWNFNWACKIRLKEKNFLYKIFVKIWTWVILKFIDNYIAINKIEKEFILNYNPNAKIEVLPTPINLEYYRNLKLERKINSLLFIGRLEPEKNLFNLLKAMNGLDNCELHLVGDGSLKDELIEYKNKFGINAIFYGKLDSDEVIKMLNIHSVFILPSYYEGISNALVEAMACKIPVIASAIPTNLEIIKDKENGLLCSTDAESIRAAILYALNNPKKMIEFSENAYKMIEEKFDLNKYCEKVAEFVKNL